MSSWPKKPEGSMWTDEQWQAIHVRGQDILVAAAAGSGKTAVLVERIIQRILHPQEPVDVDRLFVVTFTNAAAAEMKKRIGEALERELEKAPHSLHLKRQRALLNRASISTLHAFCLDVLRQHYYQLSLDPKFRIADDTEIALLQEEVLEDLLESYYGREQDEAFYALVDCFSSDRHDQEIQKLILTLYHFARSHPFPMQWLDQIVERYAFSYQSFITEAAEELIQFVSAQTEQWLKMIERALAITEKAGGPTPYAENLQADREQVERVRDACRLGWNELCQAFATHSFSRLKSCRGDEYLPQYQEQVKAIRNALKEEFKTLAETLFSRPFEAYVEDVQRMAPHVLLLIELVKQFSAQFTEVKASKAIVDFSDLEHYCLQILTERGSTIECLIPSEVALYYRQKYVELLVDEYQDTNLVQESILQLLANRENSAGNLFMVGDVKQSIYKFRMAEPILFMTKYKRFSAGLQDTETDGLRIDLARNFRSRPEILAGTNYLFKQIMDEEIGEVAYDQQAELRLGAEYPPDPHPVELILLDQSTAETEETVHADPSATGEEQDSLETADLEVAELGKIQLEARYIAKRIKGMIGEEAFQVYDTKHKIYRPIQFRDIVILLRSTDTAAPQIVEQLKAFGIPAYADLTSGYFEATEVAIMLALLKIIDNPYQDIPFVSVLRSAIVKLNEEELAQIRLHAPHEPFYNAFQAFLEHGRAADGRYAEQDLEALYHKLDAFDQRYKRWRDRARKGSLADLIWEIYRQTGFYDYVGAMPGGKQRQANLRALHDRAKQYEQTSFRGLFRFLRFVERMQERGRDLGTARALGEQEDVVRIMTIHKSKGLEFPVVFLAGLSKGMNRRDLQQKVLLHKEQGLAVKLIDPDLRIMYPTLPYYAVQQKLEREMLAEEMRVLYVALTRAKEKLVLVAGVKDASKHVQDWLQYAEHDEWLLPDPLRASAKTYLDWIGPALIRHRDCSALRERTGEQYEFSQANAELPEHPSSWHVQIHPADTLTEESVHEQRRDEQLIRTIARLEPIPFESSRKTDIAERLQWRYPHPQAEVHTGKLSVTEIKRLKEYLAEGSQPVWLSHRAGKTSPLLERPRFMQAKTLTATERGTVLHTIMQHLPFDQRLTVSEIEKEVALMVERELLTEEQIAEIDFTLLTAFYESELFTMIQEADEIFRELPFTYAVQAKDVYPDWDEREKEPILIQGVIDCLFSHQGEWVIIDYKSDRLDYQLSREQLERDLLDRYQLQLQLYASAIEEIWNCDLKAIYLYCFDGGHVLRINRKEGLHVTKP